MKEISYNFLSQCFKYDPEKGELLWSYRPSKHFINTQNWEKFNKNQAGKIAGLTYFNKAPKSTLKVRLDDNIYSVPAIVWCLEYGEYNEKIFNSDGNPWNNKLQNLTDLPSVKIPFPVPRSITVTKEGLLVKEDLFAFNDYETALSFVKQPRKALFLKYCKMENFTEKQTERLLILSYL